MNMDMKVGKTLKIKGKIDDDADGFVINLGQGTDKLALHFNPRFGESTIVCNSRDGNSWGKEQRDSHMCFSPGSEVKVRSKGKGPEEDIKGEGAQMVGHPSLDMCQDSLSHQALPGPLFRVSPALLDALPPTAAHRDLRGGWIQGEAARRAPADLSQ
uniref:Galectin n=1 Tax=Sus scrofa TaxID=9823 RepID=A0A8D0P5W6_PIG